MAQDPQRHAELERLEQQLLSRANRGAKLGLDRVLEALAQLGAPHERLTVAHVAGTNGKGSSCAMLESIALAAGLSCGMTTSPHLETLAERIRLNGETIDDARFAEALRRSLDGQLPELSFFEAILVAALLAMERAAVELAVVEVGLGGRLDASNVFAAPAAVAVTSVALDHTAILGNTLAAIAREKVAIARPGRPLVLGPLADEAAEVITQHARDIGVSELWQVARDDAEALRNERRYGCQPLRHERRGADLLIQAPRGPLVCARPALLGPHQADNAAVAVALALLLDDPRIDAETLARGLAQARWPGRLERIEHNGVTVWLDCAHNEHGAEALSRVLGAHPVAPGRQRALLFGAMADKGWSQMLARLAPLAAERFYCRPLPDIAGRGAVAPALLAAQLGGRTFEEPEPALAAALASLSSGDELLVAGSAYLVGAARSWLFGRRRRLAIPL